MTENLTLDDEPLKPGEKPIEDVGSKATVKKRKKEHSATRAQEIEDMRALLATYGGRHTIFRFLSRLGLYQSIFIENQLHLAAAAALGNHAKWLLAEVFTANPNAYTIMQNEAEDRSKAGKE